MVMLNKTLHLFKFNSFARYGKFTTSNCNTRQVTSSPESTYYGFKQECALFELIRNLQENEVNGLISQPNDAFT